MSNELLFRKNYKYIIQKTVYDSPETGTSFYCALEEETGRKVGIKVIKAKNTNALRSFITEVNVLTRLESKVSNVPTVYYHYCVGNTLYIVMQYIEGETLRQKMDTETSPLDSPEAVQRELSRLRLLASTLRHFGHKNFEVKVMNGTHCNYVHKNDENDNNVLAKLILEFIKR